MTPMIVCIDSRPRSKRAIRKTLKVLNILIVEKALRSIDPAAAFVYMISKIEMMTTLPSRRFITSVQYLYTPIAKTLNNISAMKI